MTKAEHCEKYICFQVIVTLNLPTGMLQDLLMLTDIICSKLQFVLYNHCSCTSGQIWAGHWHISAHRTSFTMSAAFFSKWSVQILESFCFSSEVVCPSALLDVWALCKLHSKEAGDNEICWRQADFMWYLKSLQCISSILHSSHFPFVQYWCTVLQSQRVACIDTPPVPA